MDIVKNQDIGSVVAFDSRRQGTKLYVRAEILSESEAFIDNPKIMRTGWIYFPRPVLDRIDPKRADERMEYVLALVGSVTRIVAHFFQQNFDKIEHYLPTFTGGRCP